MRGSSSRRLPSIQLARISCIHWNWFRPSSLQGGVAMMIETAPTLDGQAEQLSWVTDIKCRSPAATWRRSCPTTRPFGLSTFYKHQQTTKSMKIYNNLFYNYTNFIIYYYHWHHHLQPQSTQNYPTSFVSSKIHLIDFIEEKEEDADATRSLDGEEHHTGWNW